MYKSNADEKLVEQYTSRDQGIIARFLGVKKYKMKNMSMLFPSYKKALFCKAVSEILKTQDVRAVFDLYYGEVTSASFEYLEVGRNSSEELLTCGYSLIIKDGIKFAVAVKQTWDGSPYIVLSYGEEYTAEATVLLNEVITYMYSNNFFIGEKIDVRGKFLTVEDIDFDSVVLPEINKTAIKVGALDFFNKKDIYKNNGIPYKRGLIFTGVPGTGKTLTGKILMNKCNSAFIWVTADVLKEVSDIKCIFNMAKELSPCILLMEDIDAYLEKQGAVDSLKTQMDGMDSIEGIVTILCTNFPDRLPLALIDRPSRFDDVILFQLPDLELRFSILDRVSKLMNIENREEILREIADETEGLTGSHLKEIAVYALLLSADDGRESITADDLRKALLKVKDTKQTITSRLSEVNVKSLIDEIKKQGDK